jgi:signal transduction histidine kinase
MVAHDLRQPLSAMTLRCSMLLRTDLSDDQREDVQQIKASVDCLERMVSDLTDASLLQAHRMRITLARTEVAGLLHEALGHVPLAASRARIGTPPGIRLFVKGDARRLERVLEIVLSNAVEHGAPDTPIDIEASEAGGNATIAVTNRGKGIPPGELLRLFERRVPSHSARSSTGKGLGLGLYIAKGLVDAHRGRIWAASEPSGLTTFHIAIPLSGPPEPAAASSRADNAVPPREQHS